VLVYVAAVAAARGNRGNPAAAYSVYTGASHPECSGPRAGERRDKGTGRASRDGGETRE
jgi:hypothetical protein